MRSLLKRLRSLQSDEGLGIVEVVAALMIFGVIAVGMAYSLASMTKLTYESSNRETATNLAAAEVDNVQVVPDAFNVHDYSYNQTVGNVTYTISRSVDWVPASGADGNCGSGGGNLQYKRVNISVTWPSRLLTGAVRADTILAPKSRINDPSYGTILVSVKGVDGGEGAVTVSVLDSGGNAIAATVSPTDEEGCSYILKVKPGTYTIKVVKTGYVERINQQTDKPSVQRTIAAGSTVTAAFEYDAAGTFTQAFGANSSRPVSVPTNLTTTIYGALASPLFGTTGASLKLYPESAGYQILAGDATKCAAVDPENWNATDTLQDAVRVGGVDADPGASATLPVSMGVVSVPVGSTTTFFTAVQVSRTDAGNPGCATLKSYTFGSFKSTTAYLGLPYGSYQLFQGASAGATTTAVTTATMVAAAIGADGTVLVDTPGASASVTSGGSGTTITLDPRSAK
jgi:hypothetical protein